MAKKFRTDEAEEDTHPWAARSRYPDDDLLRNHGFKIHTRVRIRGKLSATWERDGKVYSEVEALRLARSDE